MLEHNSGKCSWRGLGRAAFPISFPEHCGKPCDRQWQEEKEDKQRCQTATCGFADQTLTRWESSIGSWCSTALAQSDDSFALCALRPSVQVAEDSSLSALPYDFTCLQTQAHQCGHFWEAGAGMEKNWASLGSWKFLREVEKLGHDLDQGHYYAVKTSQVRVDWLNLDGVLWCSKGLRQSCYFTRGGLATLALPPQRWGLWGPFWGHVLPRSSLMRPALPRLRSFFPFLRPGPAVGDALPRSPTAAATRSSRMKERSRTRSFSGTA